ncbi:MAG: Flp family type IVb pilin [Planctomycetales bacterium]|nr:Flp family type IVb pilin [Planctomycetales bacterium]
MSYLLRFLKDESGPTAVEYAVLLALILLAMIVTVSTLGRGTGGLWSNNSNALDAVM